MDVNKILLIGMLMSALWTVLSRKLIFSAIGLAIVSIFLTMLMFNLGSPLAAVFELSVCAGLITVIFISAISLTKPMPENEEEEWKKERVGRYWMLPVMLLAVVIVFFVVKMNFVPTLPVPGSLTDVREVLWNTRLFDIIGQALIILTGVFGVVVLFKEKSKNE
jgi:NADH-quinone oxidoreductase subunit J